MRLNALRVKGLTVLEPIELRFEGWDGDLTAIVGRNGSGKTSLMESILFGLYRILPSRDGSEYQYFHGKDATVELWIRHNEQDYHTIVNVDAVHSKMEAFMYRGEHEVLANGSVQNFDKAVAENFGSKELVLASAFAAQGKKGSFLELKKASRKALFIDLLDIEKMIRISEEAKARKKRHENELENVTREIEFLKASIAKPKYDLDEMSKKQDQCRAKLGQLKTALAKLMEQSGFADGLDAQIEELRKTINYNIETKKSLIVDLQRMETKRSEAARAIQRLPELEAAAAQIPIVHAEMARIQEERDALEKELAEIVRRSNEIHEYKRAVQDKRQETEVRRRICSNDLETAEQKSRLLSEVPCGGDYPECKFIKDAFLQSIKIPKLHAEIDIDDTELSIIEERLKDIPKIDCERESEIRACLYVLKNDLTNRLKVLETLNKARVDLSQAQLAFQAKQQAEKTIAALVETIDTWSKEIQRLDESMASLRGQKAKLQNVRPEISVLQKELGFLEESISTLNSEMAQGSIYNSQYDHAMSRIEALKALADEYTKESGEYSVIVDAFGKAIPSMEIESAGPTVSSLANDLLSTCFGPRFTVEFVTQRQKKSSEGVTDDFDIQVYDADRKETSSIGGLSGGEKVIVSEAVSLAIALFNSMQSGITWDTLFRDEVTGALDDENAPMYIQMLRRARALGHFEKVYFVAHQGRVIDLADSKITLVKGRISNEN